MQFLVAAKTLQKTKNTRDHLVWTAGNGDSMHDSTRCASNTGYLEVGADTSVIVKE